MTSSTPATLYEVMQMRGMSITDLAVRLDVSSELVAAWEAGLLKPSAYKWGQVCLLLGVPSDVIEDPSQPTPVDEPPVTPCERKAMESTTVTKKTLRELRRAKLMSQKELAYHMGCSMVTVMAWEHGKYLPRLSSFKRLLRVLDVTADEIDLEPYDPNSRVNGDTDNDA